jgi:Flp pilus assembly protein TadG
MLRTFRRHEGGLAALEFALVAPIMILLYMGMAELTMAMMAERQAAHSASVVGDLVAQSTGMNAAQLGDIFSVGNAIMKPFPVNTLNFRVSSIKADLNGVPKVVWSQGHGLGALIAGATASGFPPNLLQPGDSVVESDVAYTYTSPIMQVLPAPITYSNSFYLKPRRVSEVPYS